MSPSAAYPVDLWCGRQLLPLCPADQLRDYHVLPVQNISIQEIQAQLEEEVKLRQEEQETFTEKIVQVNI